MMPRFHNRQRRILLEGDTGTVGWWLGIGLILYALYLIHPGTEPLPVRVIIWLVPTPFTEPGLGWCLLIFGGLQAWFSDTKWTKIRYIIAAVLWVVLGCTLLAYWQVGEVERRMVPVMATAWLAEFWIAWRAFHDKRAAQLLFSGGNDY